MASPTIDGTVVTNKWSGTGGGTGGATSTTVTLTTTGTNDIVVMYVAYETTNAIGAYRNVSSVTASGLTFTNRSKKQYQNGTGAYSGLEIWQAVAATALSGVVITVTLDAAPDDACVVCAAVNGAFSTASPNDGNAGLPSQATGTSATQSVTFSTSQADDLLLAVWMSPGAATIELPTGWTATGSISNNGGTNYCVLAVNQLSVSAVQSGTTVSSSLVGTYDWVAIADAFTADPKSLTGASATAAEGTLAITVSPDAAHVSAIGGTGTLNVTHSVDLTGTTATAAAGTVTAVPGAGSGQATAHGAAGVFSMDVQPQLTGARATATAGLAIAGPFPAEAAATGVAHAPSIVIYIPPVSSAALRSIMRNTPAAAAGAMGNTPIALIEALYPDGPQPRSLDITLAGAQGTALAATIQRGYVWNGYAPHIAATGAAGALSVTTTDRFINPAGIAASGTPHAVTVTIA